MTEDSGSQSRDISPVSNEERAAQLRITQLHEAILARTAAIAVRISSSLPEAAQDEDGYRILLYDATKYPKDYIERFMRRESTYRPEHEVELYWNAENRTFTLWSRDYSPIKVTLPIDQQSPISLLHASYPRNYSEVVTSRIDSFGTPGSRQDSVVLGTIGDEDNVHGKLSLTDVERVRTLNSVAEHLDRMRGLLADPQRYHWGVFGSLQLGSPSNQLRGFFEAKPETLSR